MRRGRKKVRWIPGVLNNATKRKITGSIFPGKLGFDGNEYRTERLNEAVELINGADISFSEIKTGQNTVKIELPRMTAEAQQALVRIL